MLITYQSRINVDNYKGLATRLHQRPKAAFLALEYSGAE